MNGSRTGKGMVWAALWISASGLAQADSLTVEFAGVRNAEGRVMVSLCGDADGSFPGGCSTHSGMADAVAGTVVVEIQDVPAGRYAIQAFHDANGNFRPEIPPEGYAFGNDASFPPTFSAAAVEVRGASRTSLKMQYAGAPAAAVDSARGSHGADPPPGIKRREVREQGLFGAFHVPAGNALSGEDSRRSARRPAMLLLGGSEGGLDNISAMATSMARALDAAHPAMGATPMANRAAWQDRWQKTLQFLHGAL